MTAAIYLATSGQAAAAGAWCVIHQSEIAVEASAARRPVHWVTGPIYEIALHRVRVGELGELTPKEAVKLALEREQDDYVVARPRNEARPLVVDGDNAGMRVLDEVSVGTATPLEALLALETERQRQDDSCDHDDRLSYVARQAAAGRQPVELPRGARESDARQARRYRCRARDLRDAGQGDLWLGIGVAA